jgi:hypothetical protein
MVFNLIVIRIAPFNRKNEANLMSVFGDANYFPIATSPEVKLAKNF